MAYKKPQDPLTNNGFGIYPLTTADQVILADGSRLEKNGIVSANVATAANSEKLSGKSLAEIMLALYPVGAVYISVNSTSPASLFGGEWTQINGRFLIGTGAPENNDDGTSPGNYDKTLGSKGGEANHTLTEAEMPNHGHNALKEAPGWGDSMTLSPWTPYFKNDAFTDAGRDGYTAEFWTWNIIKNAGGDQPHNNMPPYMAVYMWKRVS